jgi:hypothetical protein
MYGSSNAGAVAGIQQQISSFCFLAAEDGVAAEEIQMNRMLNNDFRVGSWRYRLFEAMKAFVVKKDLNDH